MAHNIQKLLCNLVNEIAMKKSPTRSRRLFTFTYCMKYIPIEPSGQ